MSPTGRHGGRADELTGRTASGGAGFRTELLGYSAHLCWICLTFYQVVPRAADETGAFTPLDAAYLSSMIALCLTLGLGIVSTRGFMRVAESRPGVIGAPALTCLGTVLLSVEAAETASTGLVVAGGILTGVGSAVLAARWASVFGSAGTRSLVETLPTLLAITVVACMTTSYLPQYMQLAFMCLLPAVSGALLQVARTSLSGHDRHAAQRFAREAGRAGQQPADARRAAGATPSAGAGPSAGREASLRRGGRLTLGALSCFVALVGLGSGALPVLSSVPGALPYGLFFYLITAVLFLAFISLLVLRESPRSLALVMGVPLAATLVVAIPFARYVSTGPLSTSSVLGGVAFELMLMFGAALFALLLDLSPARTFMVSRVTLALSNIAGSLLASRLVTATSQAPSGNTISLQVAGIVCLAAAQLMVVGIVGAYLVIRNGRGGVGSAVQLAAREPAGGEDDADEKAGPRAAGVPAGSPASAAGWAAGAVSSTASSANPTGREDADAGPAHEDAPYLAVAREHGLTPRETEVLGLLAQGRAPQEIQRELVISQGTMSYHMRNVYAKLGVHSRQELMVMVLGDRERRDII